MTSRGPCLAGFFACFDLGGREPFAVFGDALVRKSRSNAGVIKNMLRTNGVDEYKVMAKRMAQTLSKKSATPATAVKGVK